MGREDDERGHRLGDDKVRGKGGKEEGKAGSWSRCICTRNRRWISIAVRFCVSGRLAKPDVRKRIPFDELRPCRRTSKMYRDAGRGSPMATPESPVLAYLPAPDPHSDTFYQSQIQFARDPKSGYARIYNVGMEDGNDRGFRSWCVGGKTRDRHWPGRPVDAIRTDVELAG